MQKRKGGEEGGQKERKQSSSTFDLREMDQRRSCNERPSCRCFRMLDLHSIGGVAAAALLLISATPTSASTPIGGGQRNVNVSLSTPWKAQHPIFDILYVVSLFFYDQINLNNQSSLRLLLLESKPRSTLRPPSSLYSNPSRSSLLFLPSRPPPSWKRLFPSSRTCFTQLLSLHGISE